MGGLKDSKFFPASDPDVRDLPRGGALLRSLRRISDGVVISGPSLLVDEILRPNKVANIADLVQTKWNGDTNAISSSENAETWSMYLYPAPSSTELPRILRSPRIGLDLSHSSIPWPGNDLQGTLAHPRAIFVGKQYRYFVHPHLLTANGRGPTFLGVYQCLLSEDGDRHRTQLLQSVTKLTGLKPETTKRYYELYHSAKATGSLVGFVGAKGKSAGSSAIAFIHMQGALERARSTK